MFEDFITQVVIWGAGILAIVITICAMFGDSHKGNIDKDGKDNPPKPSAH